MEEAYLLRRLLQLQSVKPLLPTPPATEPVDKKDIKAPIVSMEWCERNDIPTGRDVLESQIALTLEVYRRTLSADTDEKKKGVPFNYISKSPLRSEGRLRSDVHAPERGAIFAPERNLGDADARRENITAPERRSGARGDYCADAALRSDAPERGAILAPERRSGAVNHYGPDSASAWYGALRYLCGATYGVLR